MGASGCTGRTPRPAARVPWGHHRGGEMAPPGLAWWALPCGHPLGCPGHGSPVGWCLAGGSGTAVPAVSRSRSARLGAAFQGFAAVPLLPGSESFSKGSGGSAGGKHLARGHPPPGHPTVPSRSLAEPWAPTSYSKAQPVPGRTTSQQGWGPPPTVSPPGPTSSAGQGAEGRIYRLHGARLAVSSSGAAEDGLQPPGQPGMDQGAAEAGAAWRVQPCRGPCHVHGLYAREMLPASSRLPRCELGPGGDVGWANVQGCPCTRPPCRGHGMNPASH